MSHDKTSPFGYIGKRRHFVRGHFVLGIFCLGDILSWGHFVLGTFCLVDILSCGHFVLGTFCLGDVLSLGTFCPGTFCLGDILSWGQFVMGTICKGDILSGDIMSSGTFFTWGHFVHGDILSCYHLEHIFSHPHESLYWMMIKAIFDEHNKRHKVQTMISSLSSGHFYQNTSIQVTVQWRPVYAFKKLLVLVANYKGLQTLEATFASIFSKVAKAISIQVFTINTIPIN